MNVKTQAAGSSKWWAAPVDPFPGHTWQVCSPPWVVGGAQRPWVVPVSWQGWVRSAASTQVSVAGSHVLQGSLQLPVTGSVLHVACTGIKPFEGWSGSWCGVQAVSPSAADIQDGMHISCTLAQFAIPFSYASLPQQMP